MNKNELSMNNHSQDTNAKNFMTKSKNFSTPKYLKLKLNNIRFYELPKSLSNKLGHKIIKEALILGLREELNFNEKRKQTLTKYLNDVSRLKEKVKKNKEEVEQNCENLKQEFYDRFTIVENFEKEINLLNEEKKEIIKTNNEIITMKNKITASLKKEISKMQTEIESQRAIIEDLNSKIEVLEDKKANLDNEFKQILIDEEKNYQKLLEEYANLAKKCEYYEIEYNKFDKYPEELTKKAINLFDNTKSKDLLTEENLKIELAEKNFKRDELINSVNNLQKQIIIFEEKQKEMKEKSRLYGKPLTTSDIKTKINNKNKTTYINNNTKSNAYLNTNYSTTLSNRRTKTIPNKKKKTFFG